MTKRKAIRNKKYDKFAEWFVDQYGHRPAQTQVEEHLKNLVADGKIAADLLRRCHTYDVRFDAAYKGWMGGESCPRK